MGNYARLTGMARDPRSATSKMSPDMVTGVGGGELFRVDKWDGFTRWLILGSAENTFYVTNENLSVENASIALECLREDYARYINTIRRVATGGLAPKRDQYIFALALVYTHGSNAAKAYARKHYSSICRTGEDNMAFASLLTGKKIAGTRVNGMRGWGRAMRNTVAQWYLEKSIPSLIYQAIKYRSRHGFSQALMIRLSHPNPGNDKAKSALFDWIVNGNVHQFMYDDERFAQLIAYERAQSASRHELAKLISDEGLPWEAVPNKYLNDPLILSALLEHMPGNAMVRQLPRFTWSGALTQGYAKQTILSRLDDESYIHAHRIHPIKLLQALIVYRSGRGMRNMWYADRQIVDVLEGAFYKSFINVEPTGLNRMIAVDVSGSMGGPPRWPNCLGMDNVSPRAAAAAMALITMKTEPWYYIVGFSTELQRLKVNPNMSLWEVIDVMRYMPMGATNIGAPMAYAAERELPVDLFEIYTDNELNTGMHPSHTIEVHRQKTGRDSKVATIAMVAYPDTIADPSKPYMMDFVGFDPTTPKMLADFATGRLAETFVG